MSREKMVNKTENILLGVFIVLFAASLLLVIIPYFKIGGPAITGLASSGTTISNVTVSKSFSITMSGNLSAGIQFGNLSTITDANATDNYFTTDGNKTMHIVNLSSDSTVNVDFCIKANAALTDSSTADTIGLGNETYSNATTTSATVPLVASQVSFTTANVKAGQTVTPGTGTYYRFWLDVPSTTPSGTYNNSVTFTGVEAADACP